jgi:hypothetical protein
MIDLGDAGHPHQPDSREVDPLESRTSQRRFLMVD